MSIMISCGNIGSGKTLSIVYDFYKLKNKRTIYTNIKTKNLPNVKLITPDMFMKKTLVRQVVHKDKSIDNIYKYEVNKEFWLNRPPEPINIVIDEAHTIFSSRSSSSKPNKIFSEFLALARKVLAGSQDDEGGQLIFITQALRKIDVNARDLARIRYHRCYYIKTCNRCNLSWQESSDLYEPLFVCPRCEHYKLKKSNHIIEVWKFINEEKFYLWYENHIKSYYDHYFIPNDELNKIFGLYNTLQFDDLFGDL